MLPCGIPGAVPRLFGEPDVPVEKKGGCKFPVGVNDPSWGGLNLLTNRA